MRAVASCIWHWQSRQQSEGEEERGEERGRREKETGRKRDGGGNKSLDLSTDYHLQCKCYESLNTQDTKREKRRGREEKRKQEGRGMEEEIKAFI